jgi:hypothetical protein
VQHPDLLLQHPYETLTTYTSKTSETFEMYTYNMHRILVQSKAEQVPCLLLLSLSKRLKGRDGRGTVIKK